MPRLVSHMSCLVSIQYVEDTLAMLKSMVCGIALCQIVWGTYVFLTTQDDSKDEVLYFIQLPRPFDNWRSRRGITTWCVCVCVCVCVYDILRHTGSTPEEAARFPVMVQMMTMVMMMMTTTTTTMVMMMTVMTMMMMTVMTMMRTRMKEVAVNSTQET